MIEIIPFAEELAPQFYEMNVEWLKTYFYVEPYDEYVLSNPKDVIINNGGFIFFATYNQQIAGVVSLINQKKFHELSKMAVKPEFQGLKIGQFLVEYCIDFAKNKKWEKLILYSNTKLKPAISLYYKMGFKEVALEKEANYKRANIKMEIVF